MNSPLPIVPKWNWNYNKGATNESGMGSTNRTKVELKRRMVPRRRRQRAYQSYQSGIETNQSKWKPF